MTDPSLLSHPAVAGPTGAVSLLLEAPTAHLDLCDSEFPGLVLTDSAFQIRLIFASWEAIYAFLHQLGSLSSKSGDTNDCNK